GTIVTFAGNGQSGHIGDGGQAISAALSQAYGVRVVNDEVYISDSNNFKVRKIDVSGVITTIAGTGAGPFNGDNILATAANLNHPTDVAFLSNGEMLIADTDNNRVRMVLTNGTIVSIAGNGTASFSDGRIATSRGLSLPTGILVVSDVEIYIADAKNGRIRLLSTKQTVCYDVDASENSACNGNGLCFDTDTCVCQQGWSGANCNITSCSGVSSNDNSVCSGHGSCVNTETCVCKQGWYSANCNVTSCFGVASNDSSVCGGHGSCLSLDQCSCTGLWTGSNCNVTSGNSNNEAATYIYGISTFAGGNGEFVDPQKIARLSNGDLIVSDATGHAIKKISKI
ncbi:predicted protein, partial [Naegleria gruberi]